jgi:hypothetical protein
LTPVEIIVAPGDEETLTLTVESSDETAETFGFVATGLSRGWTTIEPPTMLLLPGASGMATVTVRPPRLATVGAGSSSFEIKVFPLRDPDSETTVDGTLTVLGFDDRLVHIAQPVLAGRRKGRYDIVFDNVGNVRASIRLALIDNTRRIKGTFDPPSLGVEPGMSATSRMVTRTKRIRWRRTRTLPFSVQATQDNHRSAETTANFVQHPVISTRQTGWFFGLLALAAMITAGWLGVARPAIDRVVNKTVDKAVAKAVVAKPPVANPVPTVAPGATVVATGANPPTATTAPGAGVDVSSGEPFNITLTLTAAPQTKFLAKILDPIPAGKVLQVREIIFYNPNHDKGFMQVLRNNDTVDILATENVSTFSPLQLLQPITFSADQQANVVLQCVAAGVNSVNQGANAPCSSYVLINVKLVDA